MQIEIGKIKGEVIRETYIDAVLQRMGINLAEPLADQDIHYLRNEIGGIFQDTLDKFGIITGKTAPKFDTTKTGIIWKKVSNDKSTMFNTLPHSDERDLILYQPQTDVDENPLRNSLTGITGITPGMKAIIANLDLLIESKSLEKYRDNLAKWKIRLEKALEHPTDYRNAIGELFWFSHFIKQLNMSDPLLFEFLRKVESSLDTEEALLKLKWEEGDIAFISRRILHFRLVQTMGDLWEQNSIYRST